MKSRRADCPNYDRCGRHGHYQTNEGWTRCPCLTAEMRQRSLGPLHCENPKLSTPLLTKTDKDVRIDGALSIAKPHLAGAVLALQERGETTLVMDAYRLIEIFLEQDQEFQTSHPTVDVGLLILLLGFGDPRNRYLPELLLQTLARRNLLQKPTWVVMGLDINQVAGKYSGELDSALRKFEPVRVNAK
jgi:hypothetical protein